MTFKDIDTTPYAKYHPSIDQVKNMENLGEIKLKSIDYFKYNDSGLDKIHDMAGGSWIKAKR